MMDLLRLIPYFYQLEYRIKLALTYYGYQYSIYSTFGDPPWQWWQCLLGDLNDRPQPIISFSEEEDAIAYLQKYPTKGLYVLRERYVP